MEELFRALAEKNRLRIVSLLMDGALCVCEIESCLGMSQPNASRHLLALKNAGVLESEKTAQWTYYKISERFKREHAALWSYLCGGIKKLSTYETDMEKVKRCKARDLCACIKKTH